MNIKAQFAERGVFSPVCHQCYIIDNGWFSDRTSAAFKEAARGNTRDRMTDFAAERKIAVEEARRQLKAKRENPMSVAWKEETARQLAVLTVNNSAGLGAARILARNNQHTEQMVRMRQHWVNERSILACQNMACRLAFSLNERKHHCRICGRVFCDACSPKQLDLLLFLPDDVSAACPEEGGLRLLFGTEEDGSRGLERCCGECLRHLREFSAARDMRSRLDGAGAHVLCNLYAPLPGYASGIDGALDRLRRATRHLDRLTELAAGPDSLELREMAVADVHVLRTELLELFRRYQHPCVCVCVGGWVGGWPLCVCMWPLCVCVRGRRSRVCLTIVCVRPLCDRTCVGQIRGAVRAHPQVGRVALLPARWGGQAGAQQ